MDLKSLVLAPVLIPERLVRLLDDVNALAERARREPDPVEEVRSRIDLLLLEVRELTGVARELRDGGADLTDTAKSMNVGLVELIDSARALRRTAEHLDRTGMTIHDGGKDLNATAKTLDADTRELIDGGARLTAVSEELESHLRVFRGALPRMLDGLDVVEQLEGAVETVAETVEPLQATAERVGRVTKRLSRS